MNESAAALDEIEAAHTAVGGAARGRRYATQQINQCIAVFAGLWRGSSIGLHCRTCMLWRGPRQDGKLAKMVVAVTYLYRVGDRIKLKLGAHDVVATVIEDRGLLGPGGQQLVRVSVPAEANDNTEFEVSASVVEPMQGRVRLR